jgi:hypothetical protein
MITLLDTTVWTGNAAQKRVGESARASISTYRSRVCHVVNLANLIDCVLATPGIQGEQNMYNEAPPLLNNLIPSRHDKKMLEC